MNREDELITLWIDGELDPSEREEFERLQAEKPEFAERAKAEVEGLRASLRAEFKPEIEPPYPDFFNSHIQKRIREEAAHHGGAGHHSEPVSMWSWLSSRFTIVAAAAVAAVFAVVMLNREAEVEVGSSEIVSTYAPDPMVQVVRAEFDEDAGATVIMLTGLERIPDDVEVSGRTVASFAPTGAHGFGRFYTEDAELAYIMERDADGAPRIFARSES